MKSYDNGLLEHVLDLTYGYKREKRDYSKTEILEAIDKRRANIPWDLLGASSYASALDDLERTIKDEPHERFCRATDIFEIMEAYAEMEREMQPYDNAIKQNTSKKEQRREGLLASIEVFREGNKNLWNELAQITGVEFKHERMHNDNIMRILKLASQNTRGRALLRIIGRQDRHISELELELAEEE